MGSRRRTRSAIVGLSITLTCACLPAVADSASPEPTSSTPGPVSASTPQSSSPTPASSSDPAATASPESPRSPAGADDSQPTPSQLESTVPSSSMAAARTTRASSLTLTITAGGTPKAGRYFEDIGYYAIRGAVAPTAAGTAIGVYWRVVGQQTWHHSSTATTDATGRYAFNQPVGGAAAFAFRTAVGGVPGAAGVVSSNEVRVTVANSFVHQYRPVAAIDSLQNPTISGSVYPARPGVRVLVQVRRSDKVYRTAVTAQTNTAGRYTVRLGYGRGRLASYRVRSAYRAANRPRWEISTTATIKRTKVLNAVVTGTTAAEVAKTYRPGCPVGPSKLRTITMNYLGFDSQMHRGVLIVRSTLTKKITRGFAAGLKANYPVARMNNPNVYNGNDPNQMEANNTSGFNCRKVVGNPYAQSPHSYGIAVDVNTVQNPYRDRNGTWWPKKGRPYIDRTPLRKGMLGYHSHLTTQLRHDGYFWGGRWSPGKDYQHFEYDR